MEFFEWDDLSIADAVAVKALTIHGEERLQIVKGEYEGIAFPVHFKQVEGKKWTDLIVAAYPALFLISGRLKAALEPFTGWKSYPIHLLNKKGEEVQGYYGFSVLGSCFYKKAPVIEIENWDGSDFFSAPEKFHLFTTERVADAVKGFTNLRLMNVKDIKIDPFLIED